MSCSRIQHSDPSEDRTLYLSIWSLMLYQKANTLPHFSMFCSTSCVRTTVNMQGLRNTILYLSSSDKTSSWSFLSNDKSEHRSSRFPTRSDTNRPVQSQKLTRSLKFRIYVEEEWHNLCSEKKKVLISCAVTAQLICSFVFALANGENRLFSCRGSNGIFNLHINRFYYPVYNSSFILNELHSRTNQFQDFGIKTREKTAT